MDSRQARQFIKALTGESDPVLCFQPIDDRGRKKFLHFHAKLSASERRISELQAQGAGIFITLNETDGKGRKKENITRVRALFIDCDSWTGETPLRYAIQTGRAGRRHFFFLPETELPLDQFTRHQKMLAEIYQSDPSVSDLPRVVRLPGTLNLKGSPEMHTLIECDAKQRFPVERFVNAYSFAAFLNGEPKPEPGGRNKALFKLAAQGVNLGLDTEDRLAILNNYNLKNVSPPVEPLELAALNMNAERYAQESDVSKAFEPVEPSVVDTLEEDTRYWAGWAYVAATNSFFDLLTMDDYSVEQFNNMHLDRFSSRDKPATSVLKSNQVRKFETIVYAPGEELVTPGVRLPKLNLYKPPTVQAKAGELDWFWAHMTYLIPETRERLLFLDWVAWVVQNPGKKIHFALVLQGLQGIGKSYFKHLFRVMLGETNVIDPHGDNLKSRFNGFLKRGQLIVIEELMLSGSDGASAVNRLKQWITEDRIMIEDKGRNVVNMENKFNLFCLTNFRDALKIDEHDRRFFVVFSPAKPKGPQYYKALFADIEAKASALKWYLVNEHKFSKEFEPKGRAPETHAKNTMVDYGRSTVESWLKECIENADSPFTEDLVSITDIIENDLLPESIRRVPRIQNDFGRYLRRMGCEQVGRVRVNGKLQRLWAVRDVERWRDAEPGEIVQYLKERKNVEKF